MTNEEIIAAVNRWQADPRLRPMTCGNSREGHLPLKPIERAGRVILVCSNCEYSQVFIPDVVLQWNGRRA